MKLILAVCGVLSVAACSSVPTQVADNNARTVCDRQQMARVEAQALSNRTEVVWLSCPELKRSAKT